MFEVLSSLPEGTKVISWTQEEMDRLNESLQIELDKAAEERQKRKAEYNATLPTHLRILG